MSRIKVYFSKSNASDPILAARVRKRLEALDVEIVEFSGYGTYDPTPMLNCSSLLVLPPLRTHDPDREWLHNIGRGQYEQVKAFANDHDLGDVLIITEIHEIYPSDELGLLVDLVESNTIIDKNWKTDYAILEGESCDVDITEYFPLKKKEMKPEPIFDTSYFQPQPGVTEWHNTLIRELEEEAEKFKAQQKEAELARFLAGTGTEKRFEGKIEVPKKDNCGLPREDGCANYIPKAVASVKVGYNTDRVLPLLACAHLVGLA